MPFLPSTSQATIETVYGSQPPGGIATTLVMEHDTPDPSDVGQTVSISSVLTRSDTGSPLIGSTVAMEGSDDGTTWWSAGSYVTDGNGRASGTVVFQTSGNKFLRAKYAGDQYFAGSVSNVEPHTVNVPVIILPLVADFTYSPGQSQVGQTILFTATASGGTPPYAYTWDFGDAAAGTGSIVSHVYAATGSYTVRLIVRDSGLQLVTVTKTVTVSPQPPPPITADFTFTPTSPVAGAPVNFFATASGGTPPYAFVWSFGDGVGGSGQNPTHVYTAAGTYTVALTVTDAAGGTPVTVQKTIAVAAPPPPALIVTALTLALNPTTVLAGGTVNISGRLTRADTGAGVGTQSVSILTGDPILGSLIGTAATDSNGNYSTNVPFQTPGTYSVFAQYTGSPTVAFSTSPSATEVVTAPPQLFTVQMDSWPEGASVVVDGTKLYITPFSAPFSQGVHTFTVQGSVLYSFNGGVQQNYSFDFWSDGSTQSSRSIDVEGNLRLVAMYAGPQGVVAPDADSYINSIAVTGGHKLLKDSFGKSIAVYRSMSGPLGIAVCNGDPSAKGWTVPFPSTFTNGRCPSPVLLSDNRLHILYSDAAKVLDVPVDIVRDPNNNIIGFVWGSVVTVSTQGEQKLSAVVAHDGSIWVLWNARDGVYPNWTNSKLMVSQWTSAGGWTTPLAIYIDTTGTHSLYPVLMEHPTSHELYAVANHSSTEDGLILVVASYASGAWTWLAPNPTFSTTALGIEACPDMVADAANGRIMLIHPNGSIFRVYYFAADRTVTRDDTPTLQVSRPRWGKMVSAGGSSPSIVFEDPASITNARVLVITRGLSGWNATPGIIDADQLNVGINGSGVTGPIDFVYQKNDPAPSIVRWARLQPGTF